LLDKVQERLGPNWSNESPHRAMAIAGSPVFSWRLARTGQHRAIAGSPLFSWRLIGACSQ
jgi:hypothetical protein